MNIPYWIVAIFFCGLVATFAGEEGIDFNRDIRPILSENCSHCHGPDSEARKADLRMDTEEGTRADLGGSAAIVPGDLAKSEAWQRIIHDDPDEMMPPADSNRHISDKEKELLRRWILAGGKFEKHWAYVKPVKSEVPGDAHPIDYFVRERLTEIGMKPSQPAAKNELIRRVSLDITGLPPTPEEVTDFVVDDSADAFEKVVERLLNSPRFGERWARPWLDLARYADSNGYQADQIRDSWAYRDWVIDALNSNMPFDQFTIEQLAGDLLPNATMDQKIATGFHRTVPCNVEAGVHPEENRTNQVIDRVNTTATVWLGATLECAQCHDHKFDPFSMKDYYGIFAYFNQTPVEVQNPSGKGVSFDFYGPKMDLPMSADKEAERKKLEVELADLKAERTTLAGNSKKDRSDWEKRMLAASKSDPKWEVLTVDSFVGTGNETFKNLGDGSILVTGPIPDRSNYTIVASTNQGGIRAIRVETLTHDSLASNGPARGNGARPNVIINEVKLEVATAGGKSEAVPLSNATADFSQSGWDVARAIDGDPKTGWAISPEFGKDHWMQFQTGNSAAGFGKLEGENQLKLTLIQNYGNQRVVGRLRISVTRDEPIVAESSPELITILQKGLKDRTGPEKKKLDVAFANSNPELKAVDQKIKQAEVRLKSVEPDSTLVMVEVKEPRETHVMKRGNYLDKGDQVEAGTPGLLHPISKSLPGNRLGFAQWLMNSENPLVARVTVNRWWAEIFGQGIVRTVEDFGTQAEPPAHPRVLDWLAVEFAESGWDMKHIIKTIVMSKTYQQSSNISPDALEIDPENRLLGRGPRFRLSAEMIRDTTLTVSGLLSTKMHGPPIMPYQPDGMWRQVGRNEPTWIEAKDEDRWRRGVYVIWRRAAPYPSFVNFDGPDRSACVVQRPRTNTPLQALTLLNDPVYTEAALALADRILSELPDASPEEQIDRAFEIVLNRNPQSGEREHVKTMLEDRLAKLHMETELVADVISGASSVYKANVETTKQTELAAWYFIGNVLLNLDEVVTKG